MTIFRLNALDCPHQPWRNGGGQTRELLIWPNLTNWQIRISLADIEKDGAFSSFEGVQRWFCVVEGHGVNLTFSDQLVRQTKLSPARHFDGGQPPNCHLIDGATRDLNLMVRGVNEKLAQIQNIKNSSPWISNASIRALFTNVAGIWTNGEQSIPLQSYDFLWTVDADIKPWSFQASDKNVDMLIDAWWLSASATEKLP